MTHAEFIPIMAYIAAAIQKPITQETTDVYFDLLGDLPRNVLQVAAKRVVLEHKWATFPTVAELREAATATMRGEVARLSPGEAWQLAWRAAAKIDPEQDGSIERECAELPPLVVETMRAFGIVALCCGQEPVAVVRAQFVKMYEQLAAREHRTGLLPRSLTRDIARIAAETPIAGAIPIGDAVALIGKQQAS